jgi:pimeloyl-ACP methyl ester carboxylesterase
MTKEGFVNIGKKVHYFYNINDYENRPTAIFLHGKSFKAETWMSIKTDEFLDKLNFNFIAVDYPGWGLSESNEEYYPVDQNADNAGIFINKFINKLKITNIALVGASFSVPFVINYALQKGSNVNALILVGGVWNDNLRSNINKIKIPTLIIYGEKDKTVGLEPAYNYKRYIEHSLMEIVKNSGHPVYLDNTEEFFQIVSNFLNNYFVQNK